MLRAKGARNIVLITDGMPLAGTPDGEGEWEGTADPRRGRQGRARQPTARSSAASSPSTRRCATPSSTSDVPLHDAVAMASANPARAMRIADRAGILAPGLAADFILLDDDLRVSETWVAGERVFSRTS